MNQREYYNLYKVEKFYWWFIGRRLIIKNIINKYISKTTGFRILDYGSGTGGNFSLLNEFGNTVGADVSATAIELSKQNFPSNKVYRIKKEQSLPFPDNHFDLITLLDVLEHIKDDIKLLSEIKRYLKPNGNMLITVPAYQFLWSEHDEALGHFRRYTLKNLTKKLETTGFKVTYATYTMSLLFPLIAFYRLTRRLVSKSKATIPSHPAVSYLNIPTPVNYLLVSILKLESLLLGIMKFPFGMSVVILAQTHDELSNLP